MDLEGRSGLQNGDAIFSINGKNTTDLSHDSAKQVLEDAPDTLTMAVKRGLYDPVLDEYEPIYEPIEQEDFDQPSKPTEVDPFSVQQFQDEKNPELPELRDIETPAFINVPELPSRSLTASPFILPVKPYRPFSTEPLPDIPPLEDPIILNPNYKDLFGNKDDGEFTPQTRFKLPISEQYDPDGTKSKGKICTKKNETSFSENTLIKDVTFEEKAKTEAIISQEMQIKTMLDEVKFMKKMKNEIDLDKIEMTVSLVDENIERAISVADEIKKEIDVELSDSEASSDVKKSMLVTETKSQKEIFEANVLSQNSLQETNELVELIDKTTDEIISYNGNKTEVNVTKEVETFEENKCKEQNSVDEKKLSTKQELEESILSGSVRRKSELFDKKNESKVIEEEQNVEKNLSKKQLSSKDTVDNYDSVNINKSEAVSHNTQKVKEVKKESINRSSVKSDFQSSKHKAYNIGLQTIPNIKGSIHSSYHYNLLLKTFFIHLTDVMVALSRFILTESVFNKETDEDRKDVTSATTSEQTSVRNENNLNKDLLLNESQEEYKEAAKVQEEHVRKEVAKNEESETMTVNRKMATEAIMEKEEIKVIEYGKDEGDKKYFEVEQASETRMLSGSKMAQLTERKSEELTLKMDAVISEFETKTGIEAHTGFQDRRSRSRSRIEEEVAKESDPLEWLSKVDMKSQELTETKTGTKSISTDCESFEKKTEEIVKNHETKSTKSEKGKQMYVAIVESHIFTNKDAIFDEQIGEFSETSSIQSVDEINIASQMSETMATEKVAFKNKEMKHEIAEVVLEEPHDFAIVDVRSEAVEVSQNIKSVTKQDVAKATETDTKETAQDILKLQLKEPVVEIEEVQIEKISKHTENNYTNKKEQISELIEVKESNHKVIQEKQKEEQSSVVVEEIILNDANESIEKEIEKVKIEKQVEVQSEQNITIPTKISYIKNEDSAELKIVKEQVLEVEEALKLSEESELSINKHTIEIENQTASFQKSTMESFESNEIVQESSFTAKTTDQSKKLTLQIDLAERRRLQSQSSEISEPPSTIDTPTPATVPPTPLTDEYVFKLQIPLPKNTGTPVPRDCTPDESEDEDPHIVKKKLVAHIDTTLDSPIIYDPPLPSPPVDKVQSPVYTKPGLRGGADRRAMKKGVSTKKEEILEIERKSSLLASAIDETIKSIEEYKEEVGIDTKKEMKTEENSKSETTVSKKVEELKTCKRETNLYNGYAKIDSVTYNGTENHDSKISDEWNHIDKQVKDSNEKLNELSLKVNGNDSGTETCVKNESQKEAYSLSETPALKESKNTTEVNHIAEDQVTQGNRGDVQEPSSVLESTDVKPAPVIEITNIIDASSINIQKSPLEGYRPVQFNPEELIETRRKLQSVHLSAQGLMSYIRVGHSVGRR
ncbi:unnamed protein product [Diatraea saccharalis]|uniref:PDZ domain-containing protein n=1 Tax=Diatraea saccharalis TaxID=40085 RepID=A0A9N9WFB4_9NEOP|nr:unnamed protein product [Diatraea saccharalis]